MSYLVIGQCYKQFASVDLCNNQSKKIDFMQEGGLEPICYKIYLFKNIDYKCEGNFARKLFERFCLLSWVLPKYRVSVSDCFFDQESNKDHRAKIFHINNDMQKTFVLYENPQKEISIQDGEEVFQTKYNLKHYLSQNHQLQLQKQQQDQKNNGPSFRISIKEFRDLQKVQLQLTIHQSKSQRKHQISLNDIFKHEDKFYKDEPKVKIPTFLHLTVKKGYLDEKRMKYYYIEPNKKRHYAPHGPHMNIAFQGGGAKGVSYVGVYEALNVLQKYIDKQSKSQTKIPIRSVIGSSAGGILSLAISANIPLKSLKQICLMMDTLMCDMLVETEEEGENIEKNPHQFNKLHCDPIEGDFFEGQIRSIKQLFHNFGLVEDSLCDILFDMLKDPKMQELLLNWIDALNPSLKDLLSFKPKQLARDSSRPPQVKINYYGLLYAALMSGDAMENILAYCLVLFIKRYIDDNPPSSKKARQKRMKILCQKKQFSYEFQGKKKFLRYEDLPRQIERVIDSEKRYRQYKNDPKSKPLKRSEVEYTHLPLMQFAKKITLKQYYDLTYVQFTCTSVDLNDKIERFFNHKTTPLLPVCKAVQMTGSFPIAFQCLAWKCEWGPYYVHYHSERTELDLTNHRFTDGGLLANFPLKFLDNQKFRPKYFSHKASAEDTILYGFGLEQLKDFPENDRTKLQKRTFEALTTELSSKFIPKFIWYLIKCRFNKNNSQKNENLKLVEFLLSMVTALKQSDRNLNIECYRREIIQTYIPGKKSMNIKQHKQNLSVLSNFLLQFQQKVEEHYGKSRQQFIEDDIKQLQALTINRKDFNYTHLQIFQWLIKNNLTSLFQSIKSEYQIFSKQDIKIKAVPDFIQRIRQKLKSSKGMTIANIKSSEENVKQLIEHIRTLITSSHDMLNKQQNQETQKREFSLIENLTFDIIVERYKLSPSMFFLYNSKVQKIKQDKLYNLSLNYHVKQNNYRNYDKLKDKIKSILDTEIDRFIFHKKEKIYNRKNKSHETNPKKDNIYHYKLHLIFEAIHTSHYYYPNYLKILESVLKEVNKQRRKQLNQQGSEWKDMKIDIITCTDYHAIFGVLHAAGLPPKKIKIELAKITNMLNVYKDIQQKYNSKQWMSSSIEKMKNLIIESYKNKLDVFQRVQQRFINSNAKNNNQSATNLNNHLDMNEAFFNELDIAKQELDQNLQLVIDYVTSNIRQLQSMQQQAKRQRMSQLFSFGRYKSVNKTRSERGRRVLNNILEFTTNLLTIISQKIILSSNYVFISECQYNKDQMFKAMAINQFISVSQYKLFVFRILKQAQIQPTITLKNFYESNKILLNFNCIRIKQQRFTLINKNTKPNMPLWAALMASASLPYLSGEFSSNKQWELKNYVEQYQKRLAYDYFRNQQTQDNSNSTSYISGKYISTLPLELMTNDRLVKRKLMTESDDDRQIIELAFSFQIEKSEDQARKAPSEASKQQVVQLIYNESREMISKLVSEMNKKTKFLGCCEVFKIWCEYLCCCCCSLDGVSDYFKDMLQRINVLKMLSIRINSHDNLIYNLYDTELIKVPLRLGTLDFHKINKKQPYLQDTIRQAKYVAIELCRRFKIIDNKITRENRCFQTVLQISYPQYDANYADQTNLRQNTQKSKFCRIKFISYTKWRTITAKYVIYYNLQNDTSSFALVQQDYFDIKLNGDKDVIFFLQFKYCDDNIKIKKSMKRITIKPLKLINEYDRAIFTLNYNKYYNHKAQIIGQWSIDNETRNAPTIRVKSKGPPPEGVICQDCSSELKDILQSKKLGTCKQCQQKAYLIALKCQGNVCEREYCLRCSLHHFVRQVRDIKNTSSYVCPRDNQPFQLTDFTESQDQECMMCNNYAVFMLTESCGFKICEKCLLMDASAE